MEEMKLTTGASPKNAPLLRSGSIHSEGMTTSTVALRKGLSRLENPTFELQGQVQETLSLSADETAIMIDGKGNLRDELGFAIGASLSSSPPSRINSSRKSSQDDDEIDSTARPAASQTRLPQTSGFKYSVPHVRRQPKSASEQQRQQWQDFQQQVGGSINALTTGEVQRWRKNNVRIKSIGGGGFQTDSGSDQSIRSEDVDNVRQIDNSSSNPVETTAKASNSKEPKGNLFFRMFGRKPKPNRPASEFVIEERSSSSSPMARLTRPGSLTLFMKPTKARGKLLTHLIRTYGIPTELRAEVWIACSGAGEKMRQALPTEQYDIVLSKAIETPSEHSAQIEMDLHRTFPTNYVYQTDEGIASLRHVLLAYSARNSAVGYCQSMNFIVATLLLHMDEREAFWVLASIVEDLLPGYFSRDLIGVHVDQRTFTALVLARFPRVAQHLEQLQLPLAPVAYQWFMCIFVNSLPLSATLRVWDAFLHEGPKILFRVALSIIRVLQRDILAAASFQDAYEVLSEGTKDRERFSGTRLLRLAFDPIIFGSFSSRMLLELRQRQLLFVRRELRLDETPIESSSPSPSPSNTDCALSGTDIQAKVNGPDDSGPTMRAANVESDKSDKINGIPATLRPMKRDHSHAELTTDAFEWAFSPRPVMLSPSDAKPIEGSVKRRRSSTLRGFRDISDFAVSGDASPLRSRALSFESSLKQTLPTIDMTTSNTMTADPENSKNRVLLSSSVDGRRDETILPDSSPENDTVYSEANDDDATIWDSDEDDEDGDDLGFRNVGEIGVERPDQDVVLTRWQAGTDDFKRLVSASPPNALATTKFGGLGGMNVDDDLTDSLNDVTEEDSETEIPTVDLPAEFSTRLRSLSFVMSARQTGAAVSASADWHHNTLAQVPEEELLDIHGIIERFEITPKRHGDISDEGLNESSVVSNDDFTTPFESSDLPRPIREPPPKTQRSRVRRILTAPFSFFGGCVPG